MPDYFTHCITAQIIYDRLPQSYRSQIDDKNLYMLGAQGGDVLFMYKLRFKNNLGRDMHKLDAVDVFKKLLNADKNYAAGFAAHYALDCCLHPAIYAYVDGQKGAFKHLSFEADLGLYISRLYDIPRRIMSKGDALKCTTKIYDAIKQFDDSITMSGIERCLKRHVYYNRHVFRFKRQKYKFDYDFESLNDEIEQAINFGVHCIECVLDKNIDEQTFSRSFTQH
jgi:hypothetical protein